jgi:hypothetical protein
VHRVPHEHAAEVDHDLLAGPPVRRVVLRERLLELQGEALAHDADRVDGVDQRVDVGAEEVAARLPDLGDVRTPRSG